MQTKPAGWPADAAVEVVPDVVADFGASTPGAVSVADWSIERQLTGSLLPGQVRAGSGFSVASGSVAFPQTSPPLSPWGKGAQKLTPGGGCTISATHGPGISLSLGSFRADKITGAVSDPAVHVDLLEDQARLRRRVSIPGLSDIAGLSNIDAVWLIAQIGRSAGFYATAPTVQSSIFSVPLVGSAQAERGTISWPETNPTNTWVSVDGQAGLGANGGVVGYTTTSDRPYSYYITAEVRGTGIGVILANNARLNIRSHAVVVRRTDGAEVSTIVLSASSATTRVVQVHVERVSATSLRVRARTNRIEPWSAWVAVTDANISWTGNSVAVNTSDVTRGFQIHIDDDPQVWATPTARLEATGVVLDAPVVPADIDGWEAIQQIAAATLGAAWVSESGILTYRGQDWLRGVANPGETIVSETSLADVSWSVSGDDVADRVTVTYQPPDLKMVHDQSLTIWEATEAVDIPAGSTVTIHADIEGTARKLAPWLPIWDTGNPIRFSRWAAATSREGAGTQPGDSALQISAEVVGTSRIRIRITNTTGNRLWTVDGNGNPTLIVRADVSARAGETVSISMGANETDSINPLGLDLGAWVQRHQNAQSIMEWVWSQVQAPRAVIEGVRVKPNLARQLGDIAWLTDETTGLNSKALITGVHLSGSHGQYEQTLDLVLLDVTFYDLSKSLAGKTFAQLSADWSGKTFAQITEAINSIGGA